MGVEIQSVGITKRVSAFLLDFILLFTLAVGGGWLISVITGLEGYNETFQAAYEQYETQYGVSFDITELDYNAMTVQEQENWTAAYNALMSDESAVKAYNMVNNLTLLVITGGLLVSYLILEFAVPLLLKNGQTVGKKVFAMALIRKDGVKVSPVQLFVRTVLGKFAVGTMLPLYVVLLWGQLGLIGTVVLGGLLLAQIVLLMLGDRMLIHDRMALTVVVDMNLQRIFESGDELMEYTKRIHAEQAERAEY